MSRLTKAELTTAIDIFSHPQSGDESDIFAAYTTARVAMKELKNYKDLEEAGRLIELPYAVGDIVWAIFPTRKPIECVIVSIEITVNIWIITKEVESDEQRIFLPFDIGKSLFRTKEEAEAKLAELKGENNELYFL